MSELMQIGFKLLQIVVKILTKPAKLNLNINFTIKAQLTGVYEVYSILP